MSLALIKKYPLKTAGTAPHIKILSHLTDRERTLLAEFFILEGLLLGDDRQHILTLCRTIYERDCWIQCDCILSDEQPVFRFNRAVSGKLYLRHITSRGNHAKDCVFREREWEARAQSSRLEKPFLRTQGALNLVSKKSFDLLAKGKRTKTEHKLSEQRIRRSKLCRALYYLLDGGGLNILNPKRPLQPFKALEMAAKDIELTHKKSMRNYLYTNPSMLVKAAYALRDDRTPWPKDMSKHALMLVKARSFNEEAIEAILPSGATQTINIKHHVYPSSGRLGERSSPFMAMILITDSSEKPGFYEPATAFIVPCYSEKTFIPVDSFYERELLRRLYALQFEESGKGRHLEIIKPLLDIPVNDGTPKDTYVLPDFILKTDSKTLVLEVNGSHESDYLLRKERMHQHMGALGLVLSIDAYGAELENRLSQALTHFIMQIKKHLD